MGVQDYEVYKTNHAIIKSNKFELFKDAQFSNAAFTVWFYSLVILRCWYFL